MENFKGDHNREIKIEFMTETERRSKEGGAAIFTVVPRDLTARW